MRIGILGGAFDPIHLGHLSIAKEAKEKADLSKIVFIPTGTPWLKNACEISPAKHRVEMVKMAISENPHFEVSPIEIERKGISYTAETLEAIKKEIGPETEMFLLLGMDSVIQISEWKNPDRIKNLCTVIAIGRPSIDIPQKILEERRKWLGNKAIWIEELRIDITSSEIRTRIGIGEKISHLVPKSVEEYIYKNRLYQATQTDS
jgi:nicotinate-nucleotide adenylyltransferase